MKRTRRHHSPEFKREAGALVVEPGYRSADFGWSTTSYKKPRPSLPRNAHEVSIY